MWKKENTVYLRDYVTKEVMSYFDPFKRKLFNSPFFIDKSFVDLAKNYGYNLVPLSAYIDNGQLKMKAHDPISSEKILSASKAEVVDLVLSYMIPYFKNQIYTWRGLYRYLNELSDYKSDI